jgi:hypothetical protein
VFSRIIDCDIKDFAGDDTDELTLGVRRQLIMQSAQHAPTRARMVVLHEFNSPPDLGTKRTLAKALEEKPSIVTKDLWLDDDHIRNRGRRKNHQNTRSRNTCRRYWPYPFLSSG